MKNIIITLIISLIVAGNCLSWQQQVAYNIEVKLDTVQHKIYGQEQLKYFNNSPDTLKFVWFNLYPNAYKNNYTLYAREAEDRQDYKMRCATERERGNITLNSINAGGVSEIKTHSGDDQTTIRLDLPRMLAPGDSIDFEFDFTVKVPNFFSRMGHDKTHYEITQWYPKPAVYDQKGWHADGYHYIGEFYGEYGSFKVGITVPCNFKVGATGFEMFDADDSASTPADSLAYHLFIADNVHDFAWCADPEYIETIEQYKNVDIKVLTRPKDNKKWKNVMQYAKDALDYYGKWYGEYPYHTLTVCDGDIRAGGGMEYPNLVIISGGENKIIRTLENVVMHEIGHQWFYGILGNDEMDEAWLDEGINTFSEQRYFFEKYGQKGNLLTNDFLKKRMPELNDEYISWMVSYIYDANKMSQPVLNKSYLSQDGGQYAASAYMKPSAMMWWLREYLGDSLFDRTMQGYCRENSFKHINSESFYRAVQKYSQVDVRPIFREWLVNNRPCDYSIASIANVGNNLNYMVRLERSKGFAVPVKFEAVDINKKHYQMYWSGAKADTIIKLITTGKLTDAFLDGQNTLLETNRWNNNSPRRFRFTVGPRLPSFDSYDLFWMPVPWYDGINGFRLGSMFFGGYMIDGGPMVGRHQWDFSPFYGVKSKQVNYTFNYQTPLDSRSRPPRFYFGLASIYGTYYAGIGLKREWGRRMMLAPTEYFDIGVSYRRYKGFRFWDERDVDTSAVIKAAGLRGYRFDRYWGRSAFQVTVTAGYIQRPITEINNYIKLEMEEKLNLRICRNIRPAFRFAVGYIQGPAPAQEQFFLSGSFTTEGLDYLISSGKGRFSPQEQYHVDGGANLPGYYGTHIHGKNMWAANLDLAVLKTPLGIFAGAGQITNLWEDYTTRGIRVNAGLALSLGLVKMTFPLWINKPEVGEKNIAWRWTIGLGSSGTGIKIGG